MENLMNEGFDLGYIDLTDIVVFLNHKPLDKYQLQIIEEVVFLCVNRQFIQDIENIRKWILRKYPKIAIPTTKSSEVGKIFRFLYKKHYKKYKNSIIKLIEKYQLIDKIYWQDKFNYLDMYIEQEIESANFLHEKISPKEARLRAIEENIDDIDLELLDSIIIKNKPFDINNGFPFWCNPFFTRKMNEIEPITINLKKGWIPLLEIGFPVYATLPEMQKILKENYKDIQIYRQKNLPLKARKDSHKNNLAKMIDAYIFYLNGNNNAQIAIKLDKKYGGDISLDGVSKLIKRIKQEALRFNSQADKKN